MRLFGKLGQMVLLLCLISCLTTLPTLAQSNSVTIGVGDTVLEVSGKTSPFAFVTISMDGNVIGTTTANSAGEFSQTLTAQTPGLHQVNIYAHATTGDDTDVLSTTINITEHTTTTLQVFLPSTLNIVDTNLDHGQTLQLNGKATPLSTITIYIDSSNYASTTTNSEGDWTANIGTSSLEPGQHQVFVRATDAFGAQSYPTSPRYFQLAPQTGSVLPTLPSPSQPGHGGLPIPIITFPEPGTVWQHPTITIRGHVSGSFPIELWDGDRVIASVWPDFRGQWSVPLQLAPGDYALRARTCLNQRCSDFSPTVRFSYAPDGPLIPTDRHLRITAEQYTFYAWTSQPFTIKVLVEDGQPPYKTTLQWDNHTTETNNHAHNKLEFIHRYLEPGRFSVKLDVTDAQGRTGSAYFTVFVQQQQTTPLWLIILLVLLLILVLLLLQRRRNSNRKKRKKTK